MPLPGHMTILATRRKNDVANYILVDRGACPDPHHMRYVSATADDHSLSYGEWYWGYYFATEKEARAHFDAR